MTILNTCKFIFVSVLLIIPTFSKAQSSYDPPLTDTFSQAMSGMSTINSYSFGTNSGNNVTNLQQLAASFNPYGIAGQTVIHTEWERYQAFNSTNFAFQPSSLNLTAQIPSNGGLYPGGINSGQIWSQQTYQPAKSGQNVYAMSIRMKFPNGQGMWPAIWLDAVKNGDQSEIDIVEFETMQYQTSYDWTGFDHGPGVGSIIYSALTNPWVWHPGTDFSADFHNYQLIWTPDATYKYVDDKLVYAQFFTWTASQPAQLGINLAVGSGDSSLPGLYPTSTSEFPSAIQVQSINIWGGASAPVSTPTPPAPTPPPTPTPTPSPTGSSATYTGLDTTTEGTWTGTYGDDGYMIANGASKLPSYASVGVSGGSTYTWAGLTSDPRALQISSGASARMASAYTSSSPYSFNVNLTDGNTHRVALYLLDWDHDSRTETITITDAASGTTLSNETFNGFQNGQYASWNIQGHVIIQVSPVGFGSSAVSGLFFGAAGTASGPAPAPSTSATATYSGLDTGTQGTWTGTYGNDGEVIASDIISLPSYATVTLNGGAVLTWQASSSDARALQTYYGSGNRIASTFYSSFSGFSFNLNMTDGNTHRISFYLLDWNYSNFTDTITIKDATSGTVLDTRQFANFSGGQFATWNIKGNVLVQIAPTTYGTCAVSGIFFN